MRMECGWRQAQKRWSWEFEDFEKVSVESYILTAEKCSWVFRISTDRDLKHHKMRRVWGWG